MLIGIINVEMFLSIACLIFDTVENNSVSSFTITMLLLHSVSSLWLCLTYWRQVKLINYDASPLAISTALSGVLNEEGNVLRIQVKGGYRLCRQIVSVLLKLNLDGLIDERLRDTNLELLK